MDKQHSQDEGFPVKVAAVILAAGSATRMGFRPKCLLELNGVSLLRRQGLALADAGVQQVVVVLGHYAQRIRQAAPDMPVQWLTNPDPDAGQASSLRLGLQALLPHADAWLVLLADQPLIEAKDIADLITAYDHKPCHTALVRPVVDGLPGNPVMFSTEVREQILAGAANVGCRQWQTAHPDQVHHWACSNNRYRTDVDTPEDIAALAARTGHQLKWPADLMVTA
mgnify:CR=1 FL=1